MAWVGRDEAHANKQVPPLRDAGLYHVNSQWAGDTFWKWLIQITSTLGLTRAHHWNLIAHQNPKLLLPLHPCLLPCCVTLKLVFCRLSVLITVSSLPLSISLEQLQHTIIVIFTISILNYRGSSCFYAYCPIRLLAGKLRNNYL